MKVPILKHGYPIEGAHWTPDGVCHSTRTGRVVAVSPQHLEALAQVQPTDKAYARAQDRLRELRVYNRLIAPNGGYYS